VAGCIATRGCLATSFHIKTFLLIEIFFMSKFIKLLSLVVVLCFGAINLLCLIDALKESFIQWEKYKWFLVGVLGWLVIKRFFSTNVSFIATFTHELIHTIFGLLFFHKIHTFNATDSQGGHITHSGKYAENPFIGLSPYFFPIYTLLVLLIRLTVVSNMIWLFDLFSGLFTSFHFYTIKNDLSPRQTDITNLGIFYSYVFIWSFIFFFSFIILYAVRFNLVEAFIEWFDSFWDYISTFSNRVLVY
jgi:hypothetical protein